MDSIIQSQITIEYHSPEQVYRHGKRLEGMTFRDVLNLGIVPEGVTREYNSRRYKGGMGTLIEERFFGYKANSDRMADFAEAGVELKATCIDRRKNGSDVAGERLVLTMIPYDEEAPLSLYDSHLWHKCQKMLLVWYRRDKTIDAYDQRIEHVLLFTPPVEDLRIIEADYRQITDLIRAGRADELSESLTTYLGACTKGATRAKSMRDQSFYAPGHTFITMLALEGVHPRLMQELAGHSDPQTSMKVYTHVNLDAKRQAVNTMSKVFVA